FDESLYKRYIQDDTAGIYLQASTNTPPLIPGQVVDVEGVSSPGEYAPIIVPEKVRVVGKAALPEATPVTYEQLASGQEDSQFVEITGVVRSVESLEGSQYHLIEIATGGGRLSVYAWKLPVKQAEELLDSTVRVRGVCSTQFNRQRQLFAIRLMVPRPEDFAIKIPAPGNPFAIAARPIGSLLQFAPQETFGHPVKVAGAVIYFEPGVRFFLQKGANGVEVRTKQRDALQLGDRVEALGFVSQGTYTPILQDAIYRKTSSGQPVQPLQVTVNEALTGNDDCRLIQITAMLLDRALHGSERYLILQDGDFIFRAYLRQAEGSDAFVGLENGSRVAVTGVCQIDPGEWKAGEAWRAKGFSIELRSADDVVLLESPPWWTLRKVFWMAGALAFAALAAFGWVAVLHRQVAERSRQLEIQIQERQRVERRREIEQERARIAQDLHDDIGASLTHIALLSELAQKNFDKPLHAKGHLDQIFNTAGTVIRSLDEIVWTVNPKNDTLDLFIAYLCTYMPDYLWSVGIRCRLDLPVDVPNTPLPPEVAHHLYLVVKETLHNVVKHADATEVWLRLRLEAGIIMLTIEDNGRGFQTDNTPAVDANGLGNLNRRAGEIGGRCEQRSEPGKGTIITFIVPLKNPENLTQERTVH
ncbi:MAG TPA: ATP-binding protein, partial [Candidatus Acidoferrales bacterium]|nr:ATP-binding protein [Candidatus Acidoferrales bacterium]